MSDAYNLRIPVVEMDLMEDSGGARLSLEECVDVARAHGVTELEFRTQEVHAFEDEHPESAVIYDVETYQTVFVEWVRE
jgi:hypothetical protein